MARSESNLPPVQFSAFGKGVADGTTRPIRKDFIGGHGPRFRVEAPSLHAV